jgi:hypothetical protein
LPHPHICAHDEVGDGIKHLMAVPREAAQGSAS